MKRHTRIVAILALVLSGCCTSKSSLAEIEKSQPDDELFGTWVPNENKSDPFKESVKNHKNDLHIGRVVKGQEPKSPMQICGIGFDTDKKTVQPMCIALYPTHIGDMKYASIVLPKDKEWTGDNEPRYYIFKYEVSGNLLSIWHMDSDQIAADVKKGHIKGMVSKKPLGWHTVCVTDTAENLTKYIEKADNRKLFPATLRNGGGMTRTWHGVGTLIPPDFAREG